MIQPFLVKRLNRYITTNAAKISTIAMATSSQIIAVMLVVSAIIPVKAGKEITAILPDVEMIPVIVPFFCQNNCVITVMANCSTPEIDKPTKKELMIATLNEFTDNRTIKEITVIIGYTIIIVTGRTFFSATASKITETKAPVL